MNWAKLRPDGTVLRSVMAALFERGHPRLELFNLMAH